MDIISLKLVAYGNTQKNSDGSFTCQHGTGECLSDALELCTQYKLSGNLDSIKTGDTSLAAWPFILCMEQADGQPSSGKSCYESTMNTTALPWSTIEKCEATEFSAVTNAAMETTPDHDYVPWVLVDGTVLQNTDLLEQAICKAYTGTPPASCKTFKADRTPRRQKVLPCGKGQIKSTGSGSCNDITNEKDCMSSSEGSEKCSWCTSAAVSDACNKESDAKSLPSSIFECEYQ